LTQTSVACVPAVGEPHSRKAAQSFDSDRSETGLRPRTPYHFRRATITFRGIATGVGLGHESGYIVT